MEKINNDPKLITILVIDDDAICLSILGGALTKVEYHVVAVANPLDALDVLSTRSNEFDLILTDVHMPEMSGIELLKHVENYNLPVVLMSADQNNNMILKGLQDGAVFFFVKPISIYNLSKLRQFSISSTKGTTNRHDNPISPIYMSRIIASKPSFQEQQRMMHNNTTNNDIVVMHNYASNSNGQNKENYIPLVYSNNNALKRPSSSNETGLKDKSNKRQKLVWTTSLHNKFLDAVNSLGVDKAVPKRILERMNVPGLRRENVASHLQKYRMFLNKVTEATTANEDGVPNNWNERPFRSSFVLNEITFLTGQLQQCQEYIAEQSLGLTNNPSTYEIGESSAQGASRGGVVHGDLVQNYPSEEVVRNLNRSVELLEKLQRLQAMHQQVPPSLNIDQQGLSSMDGRLLGNQFQSTNNNNNNYVGLRLSTNGELISINNTPLAHGDFVASDNNLANGINGSNHTENNVGAQEVNYEMNFANNSIHNNNYNNNAPLVDNFSGIIDDWGFYTPNVDQNAMPQEDPFGMLQGMPNLQGIGDELRELGIDISVDQENIGNNNIVNNFDFGSFDAQGNAEGGLFDGFDQGITGNGDISFENYFAQNFEQEFNQQEGGADDITKFND